MDKINHIGQENINDAIFSIFASFVRLCFCLVDILPHFKTRAECYHENPLCDSHTLACASTHTVTSISVFAYTFLHWRIVRDVKSRRAAAAAI